MRAVLKRVIGISSGMQSVKTIQLRYTASDELSALFEDFRLMCNDSISIALKEKPKSRFQLIELAYPRLKGYALHTHYILSACEVAYAAYRSENRKSNPYVKKAFLKLDSQSYSLNHMVLRIPFRPRQFIYLTLRGSDYHLSLIDDSRLKKGSIIITARTVNITFSREMADIEPLGYVGVDMNERNVTVAATNEYVEQFKEFAEVSETKERHRAIRADIGRRIGKDRRISQQLYAKHGSRERNRSILRIHRIGERIVAYAKANQFGIGTERLKGIRKPYRKENGQGTLFRGRMNSWAFYEAQRQIEYKGRWEGLPIAYANLRGTSSNCPDCGSHVAPLQERKLYCAECDKTWDRDVLASKNIMAAVVPAARPLGRSCEGEPRMQEDAGNPRSRWVEAKLVGHRPIS